MWKFLFGKAQAQQMSCAWFLDQNDIYLASGCSAFAMQF